MAATRRLSAGLLSAALLGAAALFVEPAVLRDWNAGSGDRHISVGAVRLPLLSAAWALSPNRVSVEDVTVSIGQDTYRASRIDFFGVRTSRAELASLLDRSSTEPLADRLARIEAMRIFIPELVTERQVGEIRERTTYRNLAATDVARGRIRELSAEGAVAEATSPGSRSLLTQGRLTARNLDAAAFARLFVEQAGQQPGPMVELYDSFSIEDIGIAGGDGGTASIARVSGEDVSARATAESWAGALSLLSAVAEMDAPSEKDSARLAAAMADLLGAVEIGRAEAVGIAIQDGGTGGNGLIDRVSYEGASGSKPAEARIEGLVLTEKDSGSVTIASLAVTGFSFHSTLEELETLRHRSLDDFDGASLRRLVPTIGTVRISGLDFDLPNEAAPGPNPERIAFALKELEIGADEPVNGIPTNVRFAIRNLALSLPADSRNEGIKPLLDLGYRELDLSFAAAASWTEATNELVLRELSASGENMGRVSLGAVLGNVSPDLLDPAAAANPVGALAAATAKSVEVSIANKGLFERYLRQEAERRGSTPDAVKRELAGAASFAVPLMLGNSDQAKAIGQAVARFVRDPVRLTVTATAKREGGLGLIELLGSNDPASVLDKLDVSATTDDKL